MESSLKGRESATLRFSREVTLLEAGAMADKAFKPSEVQPKGEIGNCR